MEMENQSGEKQRICVITKDPIDSDDKQAVRISFAHLRQGICTGETTTIDVSAASRVRANSDFRLHNYGVRLKVADGMRTGEGFLRFWRKKQSEKEMKASDCCGAEEDIANSAVVAETIGTSGTDGAKDQPISLD